MILDQQSVVADETIMGFPDWSFAALPKQANQIKETFYIAGSSTGGAISITGTADQTE